MPKKIVIKVSTSCPECKFEFISGFLEADLLDHEEDLLTFDCPKCDCEFEQAYTYAAGTVTLAPEKNVIDQEDEEDEEEDDEEEEEEDDEDEEEEDDEEEVEA